MPGYLPNSAEPFDGDNTPGLLDILKEVKQGCKCHERSLLKARELQDYFDGESEKYVAFRPAEDALSWLTRPKRLSFITRQAVNKLTGHLYKPGPRTRRIAKDDEVSRWYGNVCRDIHLNGVMREADRLATLHGLCMIGAYPTGDPARPINYHLFRRQEFCYWASPDDPRVATAVCVITRSNADTVRYRLWTKTHYYTFYKSRSWGYTPGGWNVARFDPGTSGAHPYGVLPFTFVTHELPTTDLETKGIGELLAKVNRALNIDKSNLALWVHHYARPLGFVSGVTADWKPRFIEGGFVPLVVRHDSTEDAPVIPQASYLESHIDISAIRQYIAGEANQALAEMDIPITINVQSEQAGGGGARLASGVSIAAQGADLITYSRARQSLFEVHESRLAALICRVASCPMARLDGMADALRRVADDMSLRVSWPEIAIDLPGGDRDNADEWELQHNLTDEIELLMRRKGLEEDEAVEEYRRIQSRKAIAMRIQAEALAADPVVDDQRDDEPHDMADVDRAVPDMGIEDGGPGPLIAPEQVTNPSVSVTVAVAPNEPIPASATLLPTTPHNAWGTQE